VREPCNESLIPALLVLGLGMALTVAPLTTTVMNSVAETRAGIASGINNAVSRTAGLLAVAVLGVVMLQNFNYALDASLDRSNLPEPAQRLGQAQRSKLAGAELSGIAPELRSSVRAAIDDAFVRAFRWVTLVGAGLAVAGSIAALMLIDRTALADP
jgi:hypothetical protein